MLPSFIIRNLHSPLDPSSSIVEITAPTYDATISTNPSATLRYQDEDHDTITVGSSAELIEKLNEPVTSSVRRHRKRNPMAIATMLAGDEPAQTRDEERHTFEIEERRDVEKIWQGIQVEGISGEVIWDEKKKKLLGEVYAR